jgi:amino acid permease
MKAHRKVSYRLKSPTLETQVLISLFCLDFMLSVTTIMKTIIGTGIISLPSVMTKLGYLFGISVYVLVIAINQFTSIMLLKAKNLSRHSNYSSIMCHLFDSQKAKAASSFMVMVNNIGICIAEIIIFKSALNRILAQVAPESIG